ncbi:MAG: hypothetical protein ABW043_14835 [Devosia sp.]
MFKNCAIVCLASFAMAIAAPAFAQGSTFNPKGTFADQYGTSFTFSLCGAGTDLCGTLDVLKGKSATPANLTHVGKQVMETTANGPNSWKGKITAGDLSAQVTVTQTGPDTINIQGCRMAILCQTITYKRQ